MSEQKKDSDALKDHFILNFQGDITEEKIKELNEKLLSYHLIDPTARITLFVNSSGGDLDATFSFVTLASQVSNPIRTITTGQAFSGGLLMFLVGDERLIGPYATLMSHRFLMCSVADHEDLIARQVAVKWWHDAMLKFMSERLGMSKADVEKKLLKKEETWMTPDMAIKLGVATRKIRLGAKIK